jgi:hypothetical protein
MLDNLNGSSEQSLVEQMQAKRNAEESELNEPTGGTEEVETEIVETSTEHESEVITEEFSEDDHDIEEGEQDEEVNQPLRHTVKIDGVESEVDTDELVAGYQRDSDYRNKTMALAEHTKTQDTQFGVKLDALQSLIESEDKDIDWDALAIEDPTEYIKLQKLQEERKAALDKGRGEQKEKFDTQMTEYIASESTKLFEVMGKEWTTDKQKESFAAAESYLTSVGISVEEANQVNDHRMWQIIFDAAQFQELQKTKGRIVEEVRKAPKSVKPGQRSKPNESAQNKALTNLRNASKSNEENAAVALMQARRKKGK